MDRTLIVDRIRRLLALSASSNIHEAALALEKARWLMDKHSIDHESVLPPVEDRVSIEASEPGADHRQSPAWLRQLHALLAQLFGGVSLIDPQTGQFYFVGDRDDFPLMRHFFVYLQRQIRTWTYRWQQQQISDRASSQGPLPFAEIVTDAERESYSFGLVFALTQRLEFLAGRAAAPTANAANGNDADDPNEPAASAAELVAVQSLRERKREAAKQFVATASFQTERRESPKTFTFQDIAFSEGTRDSYKIELHPPVQDAGRDEEMPRPPLSADAGS